MRNYLIFKRKPASEAGFLLNARDAGRLFDRLAFDRGPPRLGLLAEVFVDCYPSVPRIHHVYEVVLVYRDPGREYELPPVVSVARERHEYLAFLVEYLDVIEGGVNDVYVPLGVNRDALGPREHA